MPFQIGSSCVTFSGSAEGGQCNESIYMILRWSEKRSSCHPTGTQKFVIGCHLEKPLPWDSGIQAVFHMSKSYLAQKKCLHLGLSNAYQRMMYQTRKETSLT